jgi:hypothetical protein
MHNYYARNSVDFLQKGEVMDAFDVIEHEFFEKLSQAYASVLESVPFIEGVTGVDVGVDPSSSESGRTVVRVHVVDKENPPPEIQGLFEDPEVVLVQGNYRFEQGALAALPVNRGARFPTMQPGIAISCRGCVPGTLGAFVLRNNKLALLTAGHVLPQANIDVFQPSFPVDPSAVADHTVTRTNLLVDAAVARWTGSRGQNYEQLETGVVVASVAAVAKDDIVTKSGLATAVTVGKVDGIGRYLVSGNLIEGFSVVPVAPGTVISRSGDSGSLWFRAPAIGVGLHVGGDASGRIQDARAIACHLENVFSAFKLKLVT